jgi:hypothetical protein
MTARPGRVVVALRFAACALVTAWIGLLVAVGPAVSVSRPHVSAALARGVLVGSSAFAVAGAGRALVLGRGAWLAAAGYVTAVATVAAWLPSGSGAAVAVSPEAVTASIAAAAVAVVTASWLDARFATRAGRGAGRIESR